MFPSWPQFQRWAANYRAVPLWIEPQLPAGDTLEWVHNLLGASQKFFFLHSASCDEADSSVRQAEVALDAAGLPAGRQALPTGRQARYSYFSLEAPRYTVDDAGGMLNVRVQSESGGRYDALKVGNPFDRL